MPVEDIKQTDDAEEKQELNESELEAVDGGAYTFYIPIKGTKQTPVNPPTTGSSGSW